MSGILILLKELLILLLLRPLFSLNFIVNFLVLIFVIPITLLDKSHLFRVPVDRQLEKVFE